MKKALAAIGCLFVLWAILSIFPTVAQQPQFPQNLPANTVVGRSGITAGPAQAIPFSQIFPLVVGSVGTGSVTNAMLANMPADTFKCNVTASSAPPTDCTVAQTKGTLSVEVSIQDPPFGAKCDGVTDDTAAIQLAINSLPASGGTVLFPVANCRVSSTLTIGNGTTSAPSSRAGVLLVGRGNPNGPNNLFFGGSAWPVTNGPKLQWLGGNTQPMITISGPLQGWGVKNLFLDCNSTATMGLNPVSAMYGSSENITAINCTNAGIFSTSNPLGGYTNLNKADSLRNTYTNIYVMVPAVTNAKGVVMQGVADGTSNTDYNTFTNTIIGFASNSGQSGIYLGVADSNVFINTSIAGMQSSHSGILLDYSINNVFPLSNNFYSLEVQGGTPYNVNGSPGAGSKNNYVFGAVEANGGTFPNIKTGFASAVTSFNAGQWNSYTPAPTCGSATFTINSARDTVFGKTTFMNLDVTITAIGSCTNVLTFTLPFAAAFTGGLVGMQTVTTNQAINCYISGSLGTCIKDVGTAFGVNDNIKLSGVYEAL